MAHSIRNALRTECAENQRGSGVLLSLGIIAPILLFLGLVGIDLGSYFEAKEVLQNASDEAAMRTQVAKTTGGSVQTIAQSIISKQISKQGVRLNDLTVEAKSSALATRVTAKGQFPSITLDLFSRLAGNEKSALTNLEVGSLARFRNLDGLVILDNTVDTADPCGSEEYMMAKDLALATWWELAKTPSNRVGLGFLRTSANDPYLGFYPESSCVTLDGGCDGASTFDPARWLADLESELGPATCGKDKFSSSSLLTRSKVPSALQPVRFVAGKSGVDTHWDDIATLIQQYLMQSRYLRKYSSGSQLSEARIAVIVTANRLSARQLSGAGFLQTLAEHYPKGDVPLKLLVVNVTREGEERKEGIEFGERLRAQRIGEFIELRFVSLAPEEGSAFPLVDTISELARTPVLSQ